MNYKVAGIEQNARSGTSLLALKKKNKHRDNEEMTDVSDIDDISREINYNLDKTEGEQQDANQANSSVSITESDANKKVAANIIPFIAEGGLLLVIYLLLSQNFIQQFISKNIYQGDNNTYKSLIYGIILVVLFLSVKHLVL